MIHIGETAHRHLLNIGLATPSLISILVYRHHFIACLDFGSKGEVFISYFYSELFT